MTDIKKIILQEGKTTAICGEHGTGKTRLLMQSIAENACVKKPCYVFTNNESAVILKSIMSEFVVHEIPSIHIVENMHRYDVLKSKLMQIHGGVVCIDSFLLLSGEMPFPPEKEEIIMLSELKQIARDNKFALIITFTQCDINVLKFADTLITTINDVPIPPHPICYYIHRKQ